MLCVGIDEHGSELLEEDGVQHLAVLGEQRDGMRLPQQLVGLDATQQQKKQLIPNKHTNFSRSFYTTETPCNPQMNNPTAIRQIHTHIHTKCISTFNAPLRRSIYRRCPGMLAPAVSRGRRYTAVQTTNISSGRGKVRSQYICARLDKLVSRSDGSTARTLLLFVLWHYQSIIPGGSGQQQKEEGFQTAAV